MDSYQSDNYPSIKIVKYAVLIISIILFIFCCIRTTMTLKNGGKSSTLHTATKIFNKNAALNKFSANKVEVVKMEKVPENVKKEDAPQEKVPEEKEIVTEVPTIYENLTEEQLAEKLNRSLPSTLSGSGYIFANYTARTGMDPYLSVAIVLHETGCKWGCSDLVNTCYNVGGVKGAPGCYGGEYKAYSSLNEGINMFLDNLYYNYYARGLTTPEAINPYYAESTTWASQVGSYMYEVRNA